MGSVSDHCNKASQKNFFGFLLHVKFTFTLYCRLLSVQQHYVLENNVHTLILKDIMAENKCSPSSEPPVSPSGNIITDYASP